MQTCGVEPAGWVIDGTDCDDTCAACRLGGTEVCDGRDNDCDTASDEGTLVTFYRDVDGDGFGDASAPIDGCIAPAGYVTNSADCDDGCAACHPDGIEVCDLANNDCDSAIDEGTQITFYRDADGDGLGDHSVTTQACSAPMGFVANDDDCSDTGSSNCTSVGADACSCAIDLPACVQSAGGALVRSASSITSSSSGAWVVRCPITIPSASTIDGYAARAYANNDFTTSIATTLFRGAAAAGTPRTSLASCAVYGASGTITSCTAPTSAGVVGAMTAHHVEFAVPSSEGTFWQVRGATVTYSW